MVRLREGLRLRLSLLVQCPLHFVCGKASATSLGHSDRCKLAGLLREARRPGFLLRTAMDFELGALLASGATELSDWQDYRELVR